MATGKKSFVLYADLIHVVRKLPKAARGDLLLIILEYVNDELDVVKAMEEIDILLSVTFEPIKQQLKRDLKKYEQKQIQRSEAGKRSAELRNVNKIEQTSTVVNEKQQTSTVNVNDNVNVNVIKEEKEKETFSPTPLKVKKRPQPDALQFPFSGIEFMKAWNELMTLPKWKKKPPSAIQKSLDNIAKYDEEFAVKQINDAHAGDWQGLTFQDTDEKFLKWKKQQNGQTIKTNPGGKLTGTYQAAEDFAREIEEKSRNFVSPLRNSSPLN